MFCKNCGTQLDSNAIFCSNCGSAVMKEEQVNVQSTSNMSVNNVQMNSTSFSNSVNGLSDQNRTNNNLKNALIILVVCLILAGGAALVYFTLFGGNKDADIIDSAVNNMVDVDSMSFNMNVDMQMDGYGQSSDIKMVLNADIDFKSKLSSINFLTKSADESIDIHTYLDMNSGNETVYIQNSVDNQWAKASLSSLFGDNLPISIDNDKNVKYAIEDYLRNDEFIEKIDNNDKNIIQYRLHFTKKILEKMEKEGSSRIDIETIKNAGIQDGFDLDLYINKKENYISKVVIDLSGSTISGQKVNKFITSFEFFDLDNVEKIVIPNEAMLAQELDLSMLNGGLTNSDTVIPDVVVPEVTDPNGTMPEVIIPETGVNNEDSKLINYNYVVSFNLPAGYEASSVNSETFKIYRKNGMRVLMSIDYDTKNEFFENVENEKEGYINRGYTNVTLSEIKQLVHNGNTFYYKVIQYTDKYGYNNYEVYLCYELDSEHVYSVTYEDEDNVGSVTETSMKDFLNITVTNTSTN